jgi:hypothetical protein
LNSVEIGENDSLNAEIYGPRLAMAPKVGKLVAPLAAMGHNGGIRLGDQPTRCPLIIGYSR